MRITKRLAEAITGGLGNASKMPGPCWGIPASACQLGAIRAKVEGSNCSICYAHNRGRYRFANVQDRLQAALELWWLAEANPNGPGHWSEAMAYLISSSGTKWFRWFHSGDLQSPGMLEAIYATCRQTPKVKHWLPTIQRNHVEAAQGETPANLAIRYSGVMIDGQPPKWARLSSVITSGEHRHGRHCPSHSQGNKCGECRSCWDRRVRVIEYEQNKAR